MNPFSVLNCISMYTLHFYPLSLILIRTSSHRGVSFIGGRRQIPFLFDIYRNHLHMRLPVCSPSSTTLNKLPTRWHIVALLENLPNSGLICAQLRARRAAWQMAHRNRQVVLGRE